MVCDQIFSLVNWLKYERKKRLCWWTSLLSCALDKFSDGHTCTRFEYTSIRVSLLGKTSQLKNRKGLIHLWYIGGYYKLHSFPEFERCGRTRDILDELWTFIKPSPQKDDFCMCARRRSKPQPSDDGRDALTIELPDSDSGLRCKSKRQPRYVKIHSSNIYREIQYVIHMSLRDLRLG